MHILVVDPNIAFATLLSEELTRLGYSVEHVDTGQQAVQAAKQTPPTLAVLDMALQSPDALSLANELRSMDDTMRLMLIPLIGEDLDISGHSVPIHGVLPKPFFIPELPDRIEAALSVADTEEEEIIPDSQGSPEIIREIQTAEIQPPEIDDDIFAPAPVTLFEDQDRGFIYSRFLDNERRVRELLDSLIFEVGADGAVLTLDERLLMWVGEFTESQARPIADVVIQGWRSSEEMARILGREQLQFEQSIAGGNYMLYALSVDVNAILAVAIRGTATLGMIRHRAREVVVQIGELCSRY
jgi:DNA-binding response OmpR family regulator